MIDLHHHCLPGVDDGPGTLEAAVEQCRAAAADGIRTVVATAHRHHPVYDVSAEAARAAHASLAEALAAAALPLQLLLGHEVHDSEAVAAGLSSGECLRTGGNRRWFLLELPDAHVPMHLEKRVFEWHLAGHYPVLAHPERNRELAGDTGRLRRLRSQGVPVQVTAMSVTGEFGERARRAAEAWVREGLVDLLATDAHDTRRRPPILSAAVDRAARLAGRAAAERMVTENPARILRGEALEWEAER